MGPTGDIWRYEGTTLDMPVCTFQRRGGRLDTIASLQVLTRLLTAAESVGSASLGFEPKEIGMHSLQPGAAMEMYLSGVPVYTIMLIGRWSSDAFLRYIRKQVEQFLRHVAKQMLTFRSFRRIPDIGPRVASIEDPWQKNHRDNAETKRNIGGDRSRRDHLSSFSRFI